MHAQPVFQVEEQRAKSKEQSGKKRHKARIVGGKVAEDLFERGLCLPSGTAMTDGDIDRIVEVIKKTRKK